MKTKTALGFLTILALLTGCATQPRGPAYGHDLEFRRQVEASVPVKDWGYKVQQIRFSADYLKALVVFAVPEATNVTEVVLKDDGFGRYKGSVIDLARLEAARSSLRPAPPESTRSSFGERHKSYLAARQSATALICVTLPPTRGQGHRLESEFRRQLGESVPIKDWGYSIQEIRFSFDSHKALVLCREPGAADLREFTLVDDGFRRFAGPVTPYDAENELQFESAVRVTVTLPDR